MRTGVWRYHQGALDRHGQRLTGGKQLLIRVEVRGSRWVNGSKIAFESHLDSLKDLFMGFARVERVNKQSWVIISLAYCKNTIFLHFFGKYCWSQYLRKGSLCLVDSLHMNKIRSMRSMHFFKLFISFQNPSLFFSFLGKKGQI